MPKRRGVSKKSASSTLLVLAVLFVLGVFYTLTGKNPGGVVSIATITPAVGVSTGSSPVVDAPTAVNASADWWEVYFTDPINVKNPVEWQGSIEGRLIDKINAAQTSIHIASFEFDLTPVAQALIAAKQRGVDVRWVTDDESGLGADEDPGRGQFAMLQKAGIEVRSDNRSALMHNKFWIFDDKILWTGSTNITVSGVFKQNNNTIVIHSPELATMYEREFQEMWDGKFGPKSPSQLNDQTIVLNGSQIAVVFTSEDPALEQAIIPIVNSAKKSIRFLAFSFTDYPLADAMSQRAKAGVDVAGVFEKVGSEADASELKTLMCRKVPVRQDGNPAFLHDKLIVVDERIVITGSLNFSTNAEKSNDENVIIIDNADIARLYMQEFERVWSLANDPEIETIACG
ncbi:MAG TPA: phospholipase D-like domain-containing protein [Anaerolineales bacterium]|nr:phospholipase D-like domain-containing protein [Anaerolineales bacterium]